MNNLLDPTATEKQHVERIEMTAFLKGSWNYAGVAEVAAIITNNILTGMDLKGKKRSDFDDLESCVYSHLVDIGRGNVDLGQFFKPKQ